ncbi:uncharacterized protein LOC126367620 [Pectinophora gossypiella]|uniref:uncharacterized protein LOC126367620 n=1 Tax=Pectinophora gossypiella TaxID=13191 RepID=UPI00214F4DAA|nr:uncharacterized protein LOC126367620 [Pectinophora gossypiella]
MTLRTPRRRISPRAKRRYRVIRDFFRRALGSSSQQDIKINSSIAVNVTDLKHKIVGIEHQLSEVSRHCQDLVCLENTFRKGTENLLPIETKHELRPSREHSHRTTEEKNTSATKVLYRPSETHYRRSDESDYAPCPVYHSTEDRRHMTLPNNMNSDSYTAHVSKVKKKKSKSDNRIRTPYECDPILQKHRTQSVLENLASACSSSSYHSLAQGRTVPNFDSGCSEYRRDKKHAKHREYVETALIEEARYNKKQRETKRNKTESPIRYYGEKPDKNRKNKIERETLDQDFIADIIRKQYKPMRMFGRQSEISQFSTPVCRDQEYSLRENIQEGSELCSCCYQEEGQVPCRAPYRAPRYRHHHDISDIRSICDTRLYSSKRVRPRTRRRHVDVYNDSTLYDVVPVKEKSSPKSRRKFAEESGTGYEYYKEVPPSPRTLRPRLNLKAQQYADYEDYIAARHTQKLHGQAKHKRQQEYFDSFESDATSEVVVTRNRKEHVKLLKPAKVQTSAQIHAGTTSSFQYPTFTTHEVNVSTHENTLNKSHDTDLSDKTDKALCEIKDILQSFLQEIKKDSSPSSQTVNQAETIKQMSNQTSAPHVEGATAAEAAPAPAPANNPFNKYTVAHCSVPPGYVPQFTNPCCYPPILPVCPMSCMQNGYVIPSQSFTCQTCANTSTKDIVCQECSKNKKESLQDITDNNNETEELIKEIYKFVAQNPNSIRRKKSRDNLLARDAAKDLTSRSVGGNSRLSRHDAKVGTPTLKCYSKSCEAIGSRMASDTSYTNATHSDTILEKLSLEGTTQSDTELSTTDFTVEKRKQSKFAKVLRSIGLIKKKKKESELSETESSLEVDIRPKNASPYAQEITDYCMYGQEYYHQPPGPPYPPPGSPYPPHLDPYGGYVPPPPGCEHRGPYYAPPMPHPHHSKSYAPHRVHNETIHEHSPAHFPHSRSFPPPYPNQYNPNYGSDPQVPLCLKEIEVKSTGTQSERKISFFRKLGIKTPPPAGPGKNKEVSRMSGSTQTAQTAPREMVKPSLFSGWKKFQERVRTDIEQDPMAFGYKTSKKLAAGDTKMRKAMVKRLFYKRNPFSPRNLIVKTLLGNDPSSYGEPNIKMRPRMFF